MDGQFYLAANVVVWKGGKKKKKDSTAVERS